MKINKILICGFGSIGKKHFKIIKKNWPDIKISLLRSSEDKKKIWTYENFDIHENFYDFKSALSWSPEGVILSNPASCHLDYGMFFAKNGIPLLIEKPIGTGNESEISWTLLNELSKSKYIQIGYVFRHEEGILYLKKILRKIGRIFEADFSCFSWLPDWRPSVNFLDSVSSKKELGGGVLLELSHELDIANWLLGDYEVDFSHISNTNQFDINVEDQAFIHAFNNEGCSITFRLNFCSKKIHRMICLQGVNGYIKLDLINNNLEYKIKGKQIENIKYTKNIDLKYKMQLVNFFESIEKKLNPSCTVNDGLKVLKHIKKIKLINNLRI